MDRDSAAKFVAQQIVLHALIDTHPDHRALRAAISRAAQWSVVGANDAMQDLIDHEVLNWLNGLRVEIRHSQD